MKQIAGSSIGPEVWACLDTSVVKSGSPVYLISRPIVDLINEFSASPLRVTWYLPEVVLHERHYQMDQEVVEMRLSAEYAAFAGA